MSYAVGTLKISENKQNLFYKFHIVKNLTQNARYVPFITTTFSLKKTIASNLSKSREIIILNGIKMAP